MAKYNYTFYWNSTGSFYPTDTQLTNVQSFRTFRGKQGQLDNIAGGTLTLTIRDPQQSPKVDDFICITTAAISGSLTPKDVVFCGRIIDTRYDYYNQSNTAGDILTITCTDFMGYLMTGLTTGTVTSATSGTYLNNAVLLLSSAGVGLNGNGLSTCSTQTFSNEPFSNVVNNIMQTERGHFWNHPWTSFAYLEFSQRGKYGSSAFPTQSVSFSPTTNSSTKQIYQEITFSSVMDQVFNQFAVQPVGLATQYYPSAGPYALSYKTNTLTTYDVSTTQALNNATMATAQFSNTELRIYSVTCMDAAQTTQKLNTFDVNDLVTVNWRGTDYYAVIEGIEVSATPTTAYYTFYLSAEQTIDYLVLNDSVLGRLDYNKLGF